MCNLSKNVEINTIAKILCRVMELDGKSFEEAVARIHISDQMAAVCRPRVEQHFETQVHDQKQVHMAEQQELWEELYKQKKAYEAQEGRVFQACKALAAAVLAGQITDPEKIRELLTELLDIDYQYVAASELHHQVRNYAKEKFPDD